MKTFLEIVFQEIIDLFGAALIPLEYKKKNSNFYHNSGEIGKLINIQKSATGSKEHISFTINTCIFSPEYWKANYNFLNKEVPLFPTEPECILRQRIGKLLDKGDVWFDIQQNTDITELKSEITQYIFYTIIPYFNKINNNNDLLNELSNGETNRLLKIILLCELSRLEEAATECKAVAQDYNNQRVLFFVKETISKYGLN